MAVVDPDDDTIARWVVRHYRYDPDRRERRHVVVAALSRAWLVVSMAGRAAYVEELSGPGMQLFGREQQALGPEIIRCDMLGG